MTHDGPLILGANGRIGRMFQHLHGAGQWPGQGRPIWQARSALADVVYPLDARPFDLGPFVPRGMIVLAGVTGGDAAALAQNAAIADCAVAVAEAHQIAPVLLCSSVAVYGKGGAALREADAAPTSPYGRAKARMEQVRGPAVCSLRIANVVGADALSRNMERGTATLPAGSSPLRSYISPVALARVMLGLIEAFHEGVALPDAVNVAMQPPCTMAELAGASGVQLPTLDAPSSAPPVVTVDTRLLEGLVPGLSLRASPAEMIAEARLAGWTTL